MPELPEVESVARGLRRKLRGRTLKRIEVFDRRLSLANCRLANTVSDVYRLGKQVVIETRQKGRPEYFVVHLRMTGRLLWVGQSAGPKPSVRYYHQQSADTAKHLRACLHTDRGTLLFVDPRRFGTMAIARTLQKFVPHGVEPLANSFTPEVLEQLLKGTKQPIKHWLLRQDRLVGIGNIYASEILFAARISPQRPAGSLRHSERRALFAAIQKILHAAIKHCGTTFSDFQNAEGVSGSFQRFLKVYDREGMPCRRCRMTIIRRVQQGRSTFYCSSCQR